MSSISDIYARYQLTLSDENRQYRALSNLELLPPQDYITHLYRTVVDRQTEVAFVIDFDALPKYHDQNGKVLIEDRFVALFYLLYKHFVKTYYYCSSDIDIVKEMVQRYCKIDSLTWFFGVDNSEKADECKNKYLYFTEQNYNFIFFAGKQMYNDLDYLIDNDLKINLDDNVIAYELMRSLFEMKIMAKRIAD